MLNTSIAAGTAAYTTGTFDLVAPNDDQGARTVTHLKIRLLTDYNSNTTSD